jgi:prenyltransferase beta subunit
VFYRSSVQDPRGGLVDKPGKSRDFYHTCYGLSGLSVAQHSPHGNTLLLAENKANIMAS